MLDVKKILLVLGFINPFVCLSQNNEFVSSPTKKGDHALVVYAGGGLGYYYLQKEGLPLHLTAERKSFQGVGTVRVMWHPDHLLKVGIETGYLTFYGYTFKDSSGTSGTVALTAIPVLVEWSMSLSKRLNVFVGSGLYMLNSRLDYKGKTVAPKVSIGWMAAGSYIHPLSENLGLGTELKWLDASESSDGTIALQLQLVWKFLKW